MGIMIVPTPKGYFECPGLDSYLWLVSLFLDINAQTLLTSCHLIFIILLFLSTLTRLASFALCLRGREHADLRTQMPCARGSFGSYSYCHKLISWYSDFMSVL